MANIQIYSDTQKGCIFFDNSTVDPKFIGTCIASEHPTLADRVIIKRTDRFISNTTEFRKLFKQLKITRIENRDGEELVADLGYDRTAVLTYLNEQFSDYQTTTSVQLTLDDTPDFKLDATSTTILLDNGDKHAVNSIKATTTGDGLINIISHGDGDITYYAGLDHTVITIDGQPISGGLNDVINTLNELFTVGAFEAVVISDPYSTMVANVGGEAAGFNLAGTTAIDPIGSDIFTNSTSGNYAGLKSTQTINQAGEYFTFDIRGEGILGFGLVHSQSSYDNGKFIGNSAYANPASFAVTNSAHYGFQFSNWFHPTPNGSWTNYGASTSYVTGSGWSNWHKKQDWLDGNPVKMKVGLDENGFIAIYSESDVSGEWILHARSSYPVPEGAEFHLGIKISSNTARVASEPYVHLLEDPAPTMYFRYIESPDGNFEYPLFATAEEANYYDSQNGGGGTSHTHTYDDDPTNTTWYMPDNGNTMDGTSAPTGTTFLGNTVNWTEVTSVTNSDLTPAEFTNSNLTYQEGTVINMPLSPVDVGYTTNATISPAGSGLTFSSSTLMLQGTLADVASDTTYTITVTRSNSYGSSVGSFTITATNVEPVPTHDTPWNKALDFSGSNEYSYQVTNSTNYQPVALDGISATATGHATAGYTSGHVYSRPFATAVVFKADGHNSNQHIWNQGGGANDDNIYLRLSATRKLYFGWGRDGSGVNECLVADISESISSWHGVYIAHTGERLSGTNATATNLADCFDIRYTNNASSWNAGTNLSVSSNWGSTGQRMDRNYGGQFSVGGRGSNRSFHGKVASMVCTTLRINQPMPSDVEIKEMIVDPVGWLNDYKVGQSYRVSYGQGEATFQIVNYLTWAAGSTQVWLMGDGSNDSYSNMIRNQVYKNDQNYTMLRLQSMVSNDIQNVSINGLT